MKKDEIKRVVKKVDKHFTYQVFKCCIDKANEFEKKDWFVYWFLCYDKRHHQPIFDSQTFDEYEDLKQELKEHNIKIRLKDFK